MNIDELKELEERHIRVHGGNPTSCAIICLINEIVRLHNMIIDIKCDIDRIEYKDTGDK